MENVPSLRSIFDALPNPVIVVDEAKLRVRVLPIRKKGDSE